MESQQTLSKMTLTVFIIMNFVLAMSAFLFNGILDQVAKQMQIPLAETGFLNSAYAYGAGFGVPITLFVFRKIERTKILKVMLLLTIVASIWMLMARSFEELLLIRFLTGITGNSFWVLALGTVAILSPPEKLGSTLAKLLMGASMSLVIGMPLTRLLSHYFDWKIDYAFLVFLMLLSLLYLIQHLSPLEKSDNDEEVNFKTELQLLKNKEILFVLFSSLIIFLGYGALFTYITPYLLKLFPQVNSFLSIYLIINGIGCFVGNLFAGYVCDKIGYKKALLIGTGTQALLTGLMCLFHHVMWLTLILVFLFEFMGWYNGLQLNSGIATTTENKSSFILSLNSSNIQLGQAFGLSIAVIVIKDFGIHSLTLLTLATTLLVLTTSLILREKS